MKTIILSVTIAMSVLLNANLCMAQEIEEEVAPEEQVQVVTEVPESADSEEVQAARPMNATQTQKAEKLSEASGVPVEDILRLRSGEGIEEPDTDTPETPDGEEPEAKAPPPKGRGWGVIARWLGLHPSTAGNASGDKQQPDPEEEVDDEDLPDLPDVTPEADKAVTKVRTRTEARETKRERKELKLEDKVQRKKETAARVKEKRRVAAEKQNSAEKAKREKPDRPEKTDRPEKPGKK